MNLLFLKIQPVSLHFITLTNLSVLLNLEIVFSFKEFLNFRTFFFNFGKVWKNWTNWEKETLLQTFVHNNRIKSPSIPPRQWEEEIIFWKNTFLTNNTFQKKTLSYHIETLKREIASALHDRDKALKECNDFREKFGEFAAKEESQRESFKSRFDYSYIRERWLNFYLDYRLKDVLVSNEEFLNSMLSVQGFEPERFLWNAGNYDGFV